MEHTPLFTEELAQMAIVELTTVRDYVRWCVSQLENSEAYFGHGTDNAWDEARALVMGCINLPPNLDDSMYEAKLLTEEKIKIVNAMAARIENRIPVPYLTNRAYFTGRLFYVDERVIIPRSPIGELILNRFQPWLEIYPKHILDMCTGSGCIAIAAALEFVEAQVDAVDLSVDALEVAQINVAEYDMEDRVNLLQSDLFETVPEKLYDLILCNPPYVSHQVMDEVTPEYRHEPEMAFLGGEQGLDLVIPFLEEAVNRLSPKGLLVLELGAARHAFEAYYPKLNSTWPIFKNGGGNVCVIKAGDLRKAFKK